MTTETMSRSTLVAPTASALAAVTRSAPDRPPGGCTAKPVTMATTTTPMTASAASAHAAGMGRVHTAAEACDDGNDANDDACVEDCVGDLR